MKISQTLPKEQVKIILEGLKLVEFHLNILDDSEKSENIRYKLFDILLKVDINPNLNFDFYQKIAISLEQNSGTKLTLKRIGKSGKD